VPWLVGQGVSMHMTHQCMKLQKYVVGIFHARHGLDGELQVQQFSIRIAAGGRRYRAGRYCPAAGRTGTG